MTENGSTAIFVICNYSDIVQHIVFFFVQQKYCNNNNNINSSNNK